MKIGLRELMFFLLLMAIPVAAWWFVFKPRDIRMAEDKGLIEAKQAKLTSLYAATANMDQLKAEIRELNDAIHFFQDKLPPEKEMDKILQETWKLAEANNLAAKSVRTDQRAGGVALTDPHGPYAEQPITMELEGSFTGLYSFLLALENKPRITRIHQLKLEKNPEAQEGFMKAQLTMSIFFERNGQE